MPPCETPCREATGVVLAMARSYCSRVGGLHLKYTTTVATAASAAPKKKPRSQWKVAAPYRVPVMISAAMPPAKEPPRALNA